MVARSTNKLKSALLKKGFVMTRSHHLQFRLVIDNAPQQIFTFLSHGSKEYGDFLLGIVARQLHLSKQELLSFVDCEMSGGVYLALMQERGHIA